MTTEPGALLLREVIERLGMSAWFARRLQDSRNPDPITHPLSELLHTGLLLLGQGWRDQDGAGALRNDPNLPPRGVRASRCGAAGEAADRGGQAAVRESARAEIERGRERLGRRLCLAHLALVVGDLRSEHLGRTLDALGIERERRKLGEQLAPFLEAHQPTDGAHQAQDTGRVRPDGFAVIVHPDTRERVALFIEADRGTQPFSRSQFAQSHFRMKVLGYDALWRDRDKLAELGADTFLVLTLTKDEARMRSLVERVGEMLKPAPAGVQPLFWFTTQDALDLEKPSSLLLGEIWESAEHVREKGSVF